MKGGYRKHFFEGLMYYLKSVLFVRPVRKIITRFVRRILMRKYHEFRSWDVFMVFNRSIGAILVHASMYYTYAGRYEEKPSSLLKCLLKELRHGVFIDVGSYVGFYSLLAARHGWRVIAFEPNPLSLVLLKYNIVLHELENRVGVIDKAAGDRLGYAVFTISSSPSDSSFTKFLRRERRLLNMKVEIVTIDSVVESLGINKSVNLVLKVDVEGFGLSVLRGALKTIRELRPFILFEVHRTFDETDEIYVLRILRDLGYDFKLVEPRTRENFIVYAYPREKGCLCYK